MIIYYYVIIIIFIIDIIISRLKLIIAQNHSDYIWKLFVCLSLFNISVRNETVLFCGIINNVV